MDTRYIIGIAVIALLLAAIAVAAKPDFAAKKGIPSVSIPPHAVEVAPGLYSLGSAMHNGKLVEGYAIVDYAKGSGKPRPSPSLICYGFLGKGARWKTPEPYVVNPSNNAGINSSFILDNLALDISKWESAAWKDILGSGSLSDNQLSADMSAPDGANEVYFGSITDNNAIAITVIWGTFKGAESSRELVEWDQVYDQADYSWSASGEAGKMDFENIATHELGHSVGMDDLYNSGCSNETMYGYASNGETFKRDLANGDVNGIKALYG